MQEEIYKIREQFPILATQMSDKPMVYLDNGATTQKPQCVIDAITHYYTHDNANIHRGLYELSQRATDGYELARKKVAAFVNAPHVEECIFVRGTTEAINLVAQSWSDKFLEPGDEVIVTGLEHHSNIVPWQLACQKHQAKLVVLYPDQEGRLSADDLEKLLTDRTKLFAFQHVSNALGVIHDAQSLTKVAKQAGATVVIDGAQWVSHHATDVQEIGCDFYAFSGHKLYGPTGIGVLWGKKDLLDAMPPYQGGGDMIDTVAFEKTTYAPLPNRFEAGTPDIAGAIGLGAAIDFVTDLGFEKIAEIENEVLKYATEKLKQVEGLRILGDAEEKAAVISFVIEEPSIATMDIALALSQEGIAVRTGHHCCMPLIGQLEVTGTVRASMAIYNTQEEIDQLCSVLKNLIEDRKAKQSQKEQPRDEHDIQFAPSSGESPSAAAEELAEEFLEFDDRESKTELLMELGQELKDYFEPLKKISTAVPGCMSEVYLVGRPAPDDPQKFEFVADSNAEIVRGLIAVLEKLFSGQAASEVINYDIEPFFRKIGLDQFVSTQRRSGLDGMIKRIRALATAIVERETQDN